MGQPTWIDEVMQRAYAPCRAGAPLAPLTTFRIGGLADLISSPRSKVELVDLLQILQDLSVPWTVLGGGSNVLIGDGGIRGCVIKLSGGLDDLVISNEGRRVDVGSAATFAKLTKVCMAAGWPRSEGWAGTPGTVGGALIMNAGSRDGEIGERVDLVEIVDANGTRQLTAQECGFAYRHSRIPRDAVIVGATLQCADVDPTLANQIRARAAGRLERRNQTQPREHCAGSFFKNPPGDHAGRLLEAAGLKGRCVGGAMVSPVHANFIVNTGGATAADVVALAALCQREVEARFGMSLEWEVKKMGEHA